MTIEKQNNEGWDEWGNYVLKTMEKMETRIDKCEQSVATVKLETQKDIIELKVKAAIYGAIAGILISAIVTIFTSYIISNIKDGDKDRKQDNNAISIYYIPERDRRNSASYFKIPSNIG